MASIPARQAAKASSLWGADAATATATSPTCRLPIRCRKATVAPG